ncbi:S8 family serine peptidase [Hymenobacter sp. ASUV-10]|uniref:S8 family serine peptidase n=1 Tax=Hymenobacter aranciens TaxID=3063996 RepID=A0ABT9BAA4_9BACT|nr:S8 family serine peptidase [Hymenobacter sp. ASUV-10]MDO7875117.1 S8 family serine peptidase [Hymenobacter sp. ASUV-10]
MKNLYRLGLAAALGLPGLHLVAQPIAPAAPYTLRLAVGDVLPPANAAEWLRQPATTPADAWQGRVFRLLQFAKLPTSVQHAALRKLGVVLYDYLPVNAYTASLPVTLRHEALAQLGLRSVLPVAGHWKLAGPLAAGEIPAHARRSGNTLELMLNYYPALTAAQATAALAGTEFRVVDQDEFAHQLRVVAAENAVERLAGLPWVSTVEAAPAPGVPENHRGRTDHRANVLATDYGAGRHYDGRGVTVGHGDDGSIGPHIDFQGRVDVSTSGNSTGNHGDHVAGIIMGAGNLDPRVRGQAVGAFNFYQTYPRNWQQAPANYADASRMVRVTNSSYGDGNNAGYTANTRNVDQQMRQLPYLMHVFSAGNSGTSNFNYGAGAGWGNITGGHKMGKNVLTIGNVNYRDALESSSSRGPANDGRLKPDICAVGTDVQSTVDPNDYDVFTGTSMACPGVAGVSAQLVGAYRALNSGAEMPAALLKAALLNTAEDLGNPGPDFRFGYGRTNALRAVRVLEGRTYFRDTLAQGESRNFSISVPAGSRQLRVLLHWADPEAAVNARPALVNNLDLTGFDSMDPTSIIRPWILDHRPTPAQLNANAVLGRDSINNVEQITIANPRTGTGRYNFTVTGRAVPMGRQGFWLTYSVISNGVEVTYPIGGEGFVPGEIEALRWDAADSSQPFALDFSEDNGITWLPIVASVPGTARTYDWLVPSGLRSGRMRVRVTQGAATSQSAETFTAASLPTNLQTVYRCDTEAQLSWTGSSGSTSYTVYRLGAMYMDSVTTVTTTTAVLTGLTAGEGNWFAVCGRGANGLRTRRTRAVFQSAALRNCAMIPVAVIAATNRIICPTGTVLLADSSQGAPTSWRWTITPSAGVSFMGGTSATSQHPQVQFANIGQYTVSLTATNSLGTGNTSQVNFIVVSHGSALAYTENFTNPAAFPPVGWRIENPSSNYTWQLSPATVMGPDGVRRRLPMCNDYDDQLRGAEDYLITPPLDLGGSTNPELRFAVAYRLFTANNSDGLRVDISTDCGLTFQPTGYLKSGSALASATGTGARFAPTLASQWRTETVDLTSFRTAAAAQSVMLRFTNINDFGNNLYLSNVAVAERVITATANGTLLRPLLAASPVPFGPRLQATLQPTVAGPATLALLDALGREVLRQSLTLRSGPQTAELHTEALAAGVYVLRLTGASGTTQLRVVK